MGPTRLALICACVFALRAKAYNVPIEIQYWDTKSPQDYMVDVINEFGLKVLNEHNFLNENNVAFSPYGLAGILVALYEGVEGDSSYEILRGMQLPWNRNVLRLGFRDIHRSLKTYFIPNEGFLAGLALNKDNIEFKENYKTILAFYGFDVGNDTLATEPNTTSSSAPDIPTTTMKLEADGNREETTPKANIAETANTDTKETTTTTNTPTVDAITEMINNAETMGTTNSPATLLTNNPTGDNGSASETTSEMATQPLTNAITNTVTSVNDDVEIITSSTNVVTETVPASTGVQVRLENTETSMPTTAGASYAEAQTTLNDLLATSMRPAPSLSIGLTQTFQSSVPTTQSMRGTETTTEAVSKITVSTTDETITETVSEPKASTETTNEATMTDAVLENSETTSGMPMPDKTTEPPTGISRLTKLKRQKKSLFDFILSEPSFLEPYFFPRTTFNYIIPETPKFRTESSFLAHGLKTVEVPYMVYDTVLEYAYLPHFSAAALKLPLDSSKYYLLIILPDYSYDINRLTKRLARESNLRDIYTALKFRHVYASVPSFMVKGHVSLTTDLQRLGIRNVFEPRQRDFGPMTSQDNVYVRSVDQDITVTIRKYRNSSALIRYGLTIELGTHLDLSSFVAGVNNQGKYIIRLNLALISHLCFDWISLLFVEKLLEGPVSSAYPVQFVASYPFLFFVMDSGAHVSLMAGKILDPLNSRIL